MAGTALNQNANYVASGPCTIWIGMSVPAANTLITIHTDGTPDSTAHPNAKNIGLTKEGAKLTLKTTISGREADELYDPYRRVVDATEATIEGTILQLLDFDVLASLTPGVNALTPTGKTGFSFGGKRTVTPGAVAVIFPTVNDPAKFAVWMLYQAINEAGLDFDLNRKNDGASPFKFVGQAITTRGAGDQTGQFWKQT